METFPSESPASYGESADADEVAAVVAALAQYAVEEDGGAGPLTHVWRLAGRLEAQGLPVVDGALHLKWRR